MTEQVYGKDLAFYIYYTLTAVLCLEPVSFKKHKDTIAYFNKNYVHTGVFSNELGRKISKAEKIRNASDYNDFYIAGKEEASGQIEAAKELVQAVEKYLNGKI